MKKKLIGLATVSVLALSSQMASASEIVPAQIVDNNITSSASTIASQHQVQYKVTWNKYSDKTSYYEVTLKDLKDKDHVFKNKRPNPKNALEFELTDGYFLKPNRDYKVWVGAYDSTGKLIGQGELFFKTEYTWSDVEEVKYKTLEWK